MGLTRKVDALNNELNDNSTEKKSTKEVAKKTEPSSKDDAVKRKRFWLVILASVLIVFVAIFSPESGVGGAEEKMSMVYFWAGVISLVGVHAIWYFYPEETSNMEKYVLYGIIFFYGMVFVFPQLVPIRNSGWSLINKGLTNVQNTIVAADKDDEETPAQAQQSARAPEVNQPQTRLLEVTATEDRFTEVKIPSGVQFSIDCPDDGLAKVFHRDAQQGIIYDCAQNIELGKNLHNFRIGFSSKTETPVLVRVRITS